MKDIAAQVAACPYWYHTIALPGGIVTPGWAPLAPNAYRIPAALDGMRVLDVGAWDGYWTFEALRRNAAEVVAIDNFSDAPLNGQGRRDWTTFDLCRDALGYGEDRCKRLEISVYDVAQLGQFDVAFCFGVLYHLRHPLLALEALSAACRRTLCIESAVCDHFSPYRGGLGHGYGDEMVVEFYPGAELGTNPTNWWAPTLKTLAAMVLSCGWPNAEYWPLASAPDRLQHCRGFVKADRRSP